MSTWGDLLIFLGPVAQKKLLGFGFLGGSVPRLTLWVNEKQKLWKEWKQGNTSKEKYLEAKKIVCQAKCNKQKGKDFKTLCSGVIKNAMFLRLQRGWSKLIVILLVSKIITDEEKKRAWKSCHEKLLNTEFVWDSKVCPK